MRVIICPDELVKKEDDHVIFMAGGITGCPNWQSKVIWSSWASALNPIWGGLGKEVVLVNPRRPDFDCSKAESSVDQIAWEHRHIAISDEVFFWFPKEGACAITLFELGKMIMSKKQVRVGVEPGYCRELDVREQLKHERPDIEIKQSLGQLYMMGDWYEH